MQQAYRWKSNDLCNNAAAARKANPPERRQHHRAWQRA